MTADQVYTALEKITEIVERARKQVDKLDQRVSRIETQIQDIYRRVR
jgi:predicted  nucleic acid-binding Zn-ribbon protein